MSKPINHARFCRFYTKPRAKPAAQKTPEQPTPQTPPFHTSLNFNRKYTYKPSKSTTNTARTSPALMQSQNRAGLRLSKLTNVQATTASAEGSTTPSKNLSNVKTSFTIARITQILPQTRR